MSLMKKFRTSLILVSVLAFILVFSGCGQDTEVEPGEDPEPDEPISVTVAMNQEVEMLCPITNNSTYDKYALSAMYDYIVGIDEDENWMPALAEDWEASEDFTTWTFYIDPDANWTDGTPLTAHDVEFTVNLIANPDTETTKGTNINDLIGTNDMGRTEDGGQVEGFNVIDDKTFEINLKGPRSETVIMDGFGTGFPIVPKHVLEGVEPSQLVNHEAWQTHEVTVGPFKFVDYVEGSHFEYEKNSDYYKGAPSFDRLFLRIMDNQAMVAAMERGDIDMLGAAAQIPLDDWERVQGFEHMTSESIPERSTQYMWINHRQERFDDPQVRKALLKGINRQLMVDRLLMGEGEVLDTPFSSAHQFHNPNLPTYEYDPDEAQAMLEEADFPFDEKLTIQVPAGLTFREQAAEMAMQNLLDLGIDAEVQMYDFPTIVDNLTRELDFDLIFLGLTSPRDPAMEAFFYSDRLPQNYGAYSNPDMDEVLDGLQETYEFEERLDLAHEMQQIFREDPAYLYMFSPYLLTAHHNRMENIKLRDTDHFWDVHNWEVKSE